jgi:4-hydroxybenzoate polyprenyltransferase/phosphoserine phosphatase
MDDSRTLAADARPGGPERDESRRTVSPATSAMDSLPLVIDLDGALIKTDSLDETFLDVLRSDPRALLALPLRLFHGRMAVRAFLADRSPLDVEAWPVHEAFLDYVRREAEGGRSVVLATAGSRSIAEAMARRFSFISEVIAWDAGETLEGEAKARRLRERFPQGFIYAGDSAADLAVWEEAAEIVLVNAPTAVARRAGRMDAPVTRFPREPASPGAFRRAFRLHQWVKNALIFVPLVLGGRIADPLAWRAAFLGFIAFGCAASATYVINDLMDLPNDRRHWSKRARPFASGELSIRTGFLMAAAGLAAAGAIAASLGPTNAAMLGLYVAATLAYSFGLKSVPILDVFMLAGLFTLRLAFGVTLTQVRLSPWLLVFSMFIFLSLSMAKRHTEVLRMIERGLTASYGRGYVPSDAPLTLGIGLASMLGATLLFIIYLIDVAFPQGFYASPICLWAIPGVLFLFLGRIWLICQRGQLRDDPVVFVLKDRLSMVLCGLIGLSFSAAVVGLRWV